MNTLRGQVTVQLRTAASLWGALRCNPYLTWRSRQDSLRFLGLTPLRLTGLVLVHWWKVARRHG
jgi:hypothetical protein